MDESTLRPPMIFKIAELAVGITADNARLVLLGTVTCGTDTNDNAPPRVEVRLEGIHQGDLAALRDALARFLPDKVRDLEEQEREPTAGRCRP